MRLVRRDAGWVAAIPVTELLASIDRGCCYLLTLRSLHSQSNRAARLAAITPFVAPRSCAPSVLILSVAQQGSRH